ncbi:hypothetical protein KPH14_001435 [Odynerus spinipes]|uniref:Uncharacterized protein n=1 Tax=Odynerus spinipes TaxID=1348599 RepID=A0AAD9RV03_9HYME|nr:hypothetical protein KPH14_001435 [Odynerus spinipes]
MLDIARMLLREILLEVPWPEFAFNPLTSIFTPTTLYFCDRTSNVESCKELRSIHGLDVDSRGRLWILDAPNNGTAKIVVYDLRRYNRQVVSANLAGIPTKGLTTLVIDVINAQLGSNAYIGDPGDESIVIFNLEQAKWWKVKMEHDFRIPTVYSTDIAISQRNSMLYITGRDTLDLFAVNLDEIRKREFTNDDETQSVNVSWLGTKMGFSSGFICDAKDGLHYFIISEKASVRWNTYYDLKAENHLVLLQDELVPCITDYAMDSQKSVWGLINRQCPLLSKKNTSKGIPLQFRTIKVSKYPSVF